MPTTNCGSNAKRTDFPSDMVSRWGFTKKLVSRISGILEKNKLDYKYPVVYLVCFRTFKVD